MTLFTGSLRLHNFRYEVFSKQIAWALVHLSNFCQVSVVLLVVHQRVICFAGLICSIDPNETPPFPLSFSQHHWPRPVLSLLGGLWLGVPFYLSSPRPGWFAVSEWSSWGVKFLFAFVSIIVHTSTGFGFIKNRRWSLKCPCSIDSILPAFYKKNLILFVGFPIVSPCVFAILCYFVFCCIIIFGESGVAFIPFLSSCFFFCSSPSS